MRPIRKGEIKACSRCGEDYEHFTTNINKACKKCRAKIYLEKHRLTDDEKKKSYPFDDKERKKRYTKIRQALDKCKTKEQRTQHYTKMLKEIEENGIYVWCTDLRPAVSPMERGRGYAGRNPSNKVDPKLKYPDTRGLYE